MLTYVLRRLLGVIPVVLLVTLIVFTMNANIPGDPGRIRLGQRADPAQVEAFNFKRGYLDPFLVQYVRYLGFAPSRIYADHATFDEESSGRADVGAAVNRSPAHRERAFHTADGTIVLAFAYVIAATGAVRTVLGIETV